MNRRKKVMIIDDSEEVLQGTRALLEQDGYDVIIQQSGIGATASIRANQPDLVLLDTDMPVLSGETLASIIQANTYTQRVPILFFSSNDENSLLKSVERCGVSGYIRKGNVAELRSKVLRHTAPKEYAK